MATGKVKTLYSDKEKTEVLFPRTKVSAISDDNGNGLTAVINNAINNASEVYVGTSMPSASGSYKIWMKPEGASTIIYTLTNGSWMEVSSVSGVYVGSGNMPESYNVQIDPTGEPIDDFFAPAGYGLGEGSTYAADLNAIRGNGWYRVDASTANLPSGFSYAAVLAMRRTNQQLVQWLVDTTTTRRQLMRYSSDGGATWVEEWINPPMLVGTEYRTTERWNGKAVYTRLGSYTFTEDFGTTSTVSNKAISFGSISATKILSAELVLVAIESTDREYPVPITAGSGGLVSVNAVLHNGAVVLIANKYVISAGGVMYCTLRYTKD